MWTNIFLTRVENSTPETFSTPIGFKIRKLIKPALRPILKLASGRRIHVENYPELEKGKPYIFVSTHGFVEDIITNYAYIDRCAYTLIGTPDQVEHNPLMYAAWVCGMVYVDKLSVQNRKDAVDKMTHVLNNDTSVIIYAEGAWNNTENLLVQPLFASPWILSQRTGCKVVPIAMYQEYKKKDVWYKAGEPIDFTGIEKKEALCILRDSMASLEYDLIEKHATVLKRSELGPEYRMDFINERMKEYLRTKWTRDDWDMEITIYRDKDLPPVPEEVRASFDNVEITPKNAKILAPILLQREEDKKYDLVQYIKKNWKKN